MSWNGANTRYRSPARPGNTAPVTAAGYDATPRDGSTASRIPAWGRPPASPGYVTIGSIRYGVRFAAATPASIREEVPPRGDALNQQHTHGDGDDCCCGVVQLLSPSRIPLPADKTPAINRRGIFSRINSVEAPCGPPVCADPPSVPVYRSTLQWSQQQQQQQQRSPPKGCFGASRGEHAPARDGVSMQQKCVQRDLPSQSTGSPARRRVLVRPKPDLPAYLKLCSSASSDSETSHLLTPSGSKENLAEEQESAPRRNTLDRLPKFRFGGGGKKGASGEGSSKGSGHKKKPPRSSDKTESLRELTERLKGNTSAATSCPISERRGQAEHTPSPPTDATGGVVGSGHAPEKTTSFVDNPAVRHSDMDEEERTEVIKEEDIFECVTLKLSKPESRAIVGSYIQRTIPIRSASFSQVDFSPADGKYIRSSARTSPFSGFTSSTTSGVLPLSPSSVIAGGSLTLPRKRLPDISVSTLVGPSSSTTIGTEEAIGSTPSVDSAVGSDEGFVTSVIPKIPIANKGNVGEPGGSPDSSHKPPGSRSLTYPLPRRGSRSDEDIPFSSIDGNGLKSLLYVPVATGAGRELQEVAEESETSLTDSGVTPSGCEPPCDTNNSGVRNATDSAVIAVVTGINVYEGPRSDASTDEQVQQRSEGNVMDCLQSSVPEHCVGDASQSAACQRLEHPVQFADCPIEDRSTHASAGSDTARSEGDLEEDVTAVSPQIISERHQSLHRPTHHVSSDSYQPRECSDYRSGEVEPSISPTHFIAQIACQDVVSANELQDDQKGFDYVQRPEEGCGEIELTNRESSVNDGADAGVFVTQWPKYTSDEFYENSQVPSANVHSSQEVTKGSEESQPLESEGRNIWLPQHESASESEEQQKEDTYFPNHVPEEKTVHETKDILTEHSTNYAQENEPVTPWQAQVVLNTADDPCVRMEDTVENAPWPTTECLPRWSGEGTEGDRTSNEWGSAQEESQSPDESSQRPQWTKTTAERPRLVCQSSEERDEDGPRPSPRRYQLLARADSLSEGESDHGDRCPVTPLRERDRTASPSFFAPSDLSDSEGRSGGGGGTVGGDMRSPHTPRRYSKRPLRGPYGQMLEAEMKKPETNRIFSKLQYNEELKFLEEYVSPPPQRPSSPTTVNSSRSSPAITDAPADSRPNSTRPRSLTTQSLDDSQLKSGYGNSSTSAPTPHPRNSPKRKVSANIPHSAPNPATSAPVFVGHHRTTSSPSQLERYAVTRQEESPRTRPEATPELLAELLRGSSERLFVPGGATTNGNSVQHWKDTRTHVVVEVFDTERSYVEALQILVMKYLKPLKSPENSGLVDAALVDEIFYQVPAILTHHEVFLEELRKRLDSWDINQKIGDVFLDTFTKQPVIDTYTAFINNWKTAKEAIKSTSQAKPAFARFLEAMAREHKGKLALDCLLIKPVQRIPRYELLMQRLLKHTATSHPDHQLLLEAQRSIHDLAVKINCTERETLEYEAQQQTLKELEALVEGLLNLVAAERSFLRHDLVTMASGQGTRKERALFLFSDLLVITSIKRRSGTIRKPSTSCPGSVASTLEANKYKLLMRTPLDDLEIVKAKDENLRRMMREMELLAEDVATLTQINDLTATLHCPHAQLEELVRDMLGTLNKQLADRQTSDSQLSYLELTLNTQSGIENISVVFTKPEKKTSWEESFNEAKQKLALSADRRPSPEFLSPLPIRKTRAGLQFTCAAPTLGLNAYNMRDVWVCNSDGYVGQVCVLSLQPEPTVISCNGVCNARILCVASIPAAVVGSPGCAIVPGTFSNSKAGISISVEDTDEGGGNIQLDSSSSSEDEDEDESSGPGQGAEDEQRRIRSASDSITSESTLLSDDTDSLQPTMWLGTEDGCIHVYNCSDNIRIKKNKVKIQHGSSVLCIIYLDNRVFVSLANGDISVYIRDHNGGWNTTDPYTVSVGTAAMPVTSMLPIVGRLWCGCHNAIKILNTASLEVEHSFQVNADSNRAVTCMALSGFGVWVSLQNLAIIRLFHATSYECLCDVNVTPAVIKMLASCDDIICQHKVACLRVTSLLACKDLLWIGTSAGVILTMPIPHIAASTTKLTNTPNATGVPHGHTGHVRFLTSVETVPAPIGESLLVRPSSHHRYSLLNKPDLLSHQSASANSVKLLVISGGDGYEDFRTSSASEVAGREDSTNHLLLWHV